METRKLIELYPWEKNPKSVSQKGYERLKNQIELLGIYKPLLVTSDNIVIGGNQRIKAMKELGIEEVWVATIDFRELEGRWYAFINGQQQLKSFDSKDQAMTEYALSDNSRAGQYDEDMLANLLSEVNLDGSLEYAIDFDEPINIDEAIEQEAKKKDSYNITITCINAEEQADTKTKLKALGYSIK